ncbi:MAG TPA: hypothetical protein VFH64_12640 [Amnibacterium sp.]|nr:hypothetical protein [Amnibacterium sp.]
MNRRLRSCIPRRILQSFRGEGARSCVYLRETAEFTLIPVRALERIDVA